MSKLEKLNIKPVKVEKRYIDLIKKNIHRKIYKIDSEELFNNLMKLYPGMKHSKIIFPALRRAFENNGEIFVYDFIDKEDTIFNWKFKL